MKRLLLVLAAFAVFAPSAQAGFAGAGANDGDDAVFAADPGEANRLTITGQGAAGVIFEDSASPIRAGRRCTSLTPNRVSCEAGFGFVVARLEDGDDEVTTAGTFGREPQGGFLLIDGQQGADTIRAEVGRSHIDGGIGTDRLIAGPQTQSIDAVDLVRRGEFSEMPDHRRERDEVTCTAAVQGAFVLPLRVDANDVVSGPCPQRHVFLEEFVLIEGTEGADNLQPAGEPSRVFGLGGDDTVFGVDLDDRADGGAGADRLTGGGLLLGGTGNDRLDAGARASWQGRPRLDGQAGDDRLLGSAASDSLAGGTGADVVSGRDGSDLIRVRDGVRDRVVCGSGRDRVSADRRDSVASDCEVVSRG